LKSNIHGKKAVLFFIVFAVLVLAAQPPPTSAQTWSLDSNGSDNSTYDGDGTIQIDAPDGTWQMYYTTLPQNWQSFTISVDVNAKDLRGFYVIAKGDLPLIGETNDLTCSIGPFSDDGGSAFRESASFNGSPNYGQMCFNKIQTNTWYTLAISVDCAKKWYDLKIFNESGSEMGSSGGVITAEVLTPITQLKYVGFGAGLNGGSYTVRNVKLITDPPLPESEPAKTPLAPVLAFSCQSSAINSSLFKVDVNGNITLDGAPLSSAQIFFSYSTGNGTLWTDIASVCSDERGNYSLTWMPTEAATYLLRGTYSGNSTVSAASKTVSFAILPYEQKSVFSVTSNSTISSFAFNSTSNQISFSVTGLNGTAGYTEITIPKTMLTDASNLQVRLDGTEVSYTAQDQGDCWVISIAYHHSSHEVVVALNQENSNLYGGLPPQLVYVVLALVVSVAATALAVLFGMTRRKNSGD
jgi:hypothetical protein